MSRWRFFLTSCVSAVNFRHASLLAALVDDRLDLTDQRAVCIEQSPAQSSFGMGGKLWICKNSVNG